MLAYFRIIRPINCFMAAVAVYIATLIAGLGYYPLPIFPMLTVFFVCAGGMVINDYFDIEADRINKPNRPLPSGKIDKKTALLYSLSLFIMGIALSLFINQYAFTVAVMVSLLLILYAWKLKKVVMVGHLTVSFLVALTFIYGGLVNMNLLSLMPLAILAFLSNTGREIYKSIEDVLGDKTVAIQTVPIKYGVLKAKLIAASFVVSAVILSFVPFFLEIFGVVYLFFVAIADAIFLIAVILPVKFSAKLCKLGMLLALVAFLLGTIA